MFNFFKRKPKPVWDIVDYKIIGDYMDINYPDPCVDKMYIFGIKEVDLNSGNERWREIHKLDFEADSYLEFLETKLGS